MPIPTDAERKAKAEADKAEHDARAAKVAADSAEAKALIPDLTAITAGKLTLNADEPMRAALLSQGALADAVTNLIEDLRDDLGLDRRGRLREGLDKSQVLIVDSIDLAASDLIYVELSSQLRMLIERARQLLGKEAAVDVGASAIGAIIPGLLTMLSSSRTVSTHALTPDATATATAVAGALVQLDVDVILDGFHLTPSGDDNEMTKLETDLRAERAELDALVKGKGDRAAEAESLMKTIDATILAAHAIPEGATRSVFATAALRSLLHDATNGKVTHVLFAKGLAGSALQTVDDRPLMFDDRYMLLAEASVSYALLETKDGGRLVAAGVAIGSAELSGTLGASRGNSQISYSKRGGATSTPVDGV